MSFLNLLKWEGERDKKHVKTMSTERTKRRNRKPRFSFFFFIYKGAYSRLVFANNFSYKSVL